jgi:hypothetical protein
VTHYQKDDAGSLLADVRCAECLKASKAAA